MDEPREEQKLVIGIDLGTADSYVGYIRGGAIEVVQNEVSQRKTPSLVGFTDRERLLGDSALSQIKSNAKNTCRNFKHLLGQRFDSPAIKSEKFWSTCPLVASEDGFAGYSVSYKGEMTQFSATEVAAMFLTKLKQVTEDWCGAKVADAVIAVPSSFSDFQRQALLDSAAIADLNVLRVVNDHTATALEYGFFRNANFDAEKPTTVAFCQMGHSNFSVAIVQFLKGKLTVLCERSDKVGGRDMDECLIRAFAEQFKKKTGCDVLTNKKACFKLEDAVAKTKKILSANSEASVSCECLMEDQDFGSNVDRDTFLDMCKPMMRKVSDVLEAAKAACNVPVSSVDAVEICGGAARVPWVKEMCSKAFGGKELSTTMNADECVARGCALQAAILSPLYKVREFKVEDSSRFPISLGWQMPVDGNNGSVKAMSAVVFAEDSVMNYMKVITFRRKAPFELTAAYADEKMLPQGTPKDLGTYTIEVPAHEAVKKVKVKTALTLHGTFSVQGAQLVEELEEHGTPAPDAAEDHEASRKRKIKRGDLQISKKGCPGLGEGALKRSKEREEKMIQDMQEVIETNARKNDLEAYILGMRSGIAEGGKYAAYIKAEDGAALLKHLDSAEDWLYDHPDDPKEAFVQKLNELKVLGGPGERRYRDDTRRPELIHTLEESIGRFKAAAKKPTRSITDNAKLQGLEKTCDEVHRWLSDLKEQQSKLSKLDNSVLTTETLEAKTEELAKLAHSVLGQGDSASQNGQGKAVDVDKPLDAKAAAQLSAAQ